MKQKTPERAVCCYGGGQAGFPPCAPAAAGSLPPRLVLWLSLLQFDIAGKPFLNIYTYIYYCLQSKVIQCKGIAFLHPAIQGLVGCRRWGMLLPDSQGSWRFCLSPGKVIPPRERGGKLVLSSGESLWRAGGEGGMRKGLADAADLVPMCRWQKSER